MGYATAADIEHEKQVATILSEKWQCQFKKMPDRYWVDYMLFKGGAPKAILEVKFRSIKFGKYDNGMIMPLCKYVNGWLYAKNLGIPFIYVNKTTDGLWYTPKMKSEGYAIDWLGRDDRDPGNDKEPQVLIPLSEWKQIHLPDHKEFINVVEKEFGAVEIIQ